MSEDDSISRVGRAGALLAGGEVASKALVFVRNAVVANMISREDFGLATTFALTVSALELASDVGVRQFIVQNADGDREDIQHAAHLWQLLRGLALGALLLLGAPLVAALFDAPQAVDDFRVLAIVPVLRGATHLDLARFERTLRFGQSAGADVLTETVQTVAAIALAVALGDQRAILYALVARAATSWLVTRVLAERPYRVRSDRETFRSIVAFGWPLLINGLVIFAIMQGDRLLVGAFYDLTDLAGYSIAFGLALVPSLMLARINGRLLLPLLAEAQHDEVRFRRAYDRSTQVQGLLASLLAAGFVTVGPWLLVLIYGEQYADVADLLGIFGAMQAIRLLRIAPSQAALARGESRNAMRANIVRMLGFGVVAGFAATGAPLWVLAAAGTGAEAAALVAATVLLSRSHGVPARTTLTTAARAAVAPAAATAALLVLGDATTTRFLVGAVAAVLVVGTTTTADTRRWMQGLLRRLRGRQTGATS